MREDTEMEPIPYRFTVKGDIYIDETYLEEARAAGHYPESDKGKRNKAVGYLYPCDVHFEIIDDEINIVGIDRKILIDKS
jgi:hypothetical protein